MFEKIIKIEDEAVFALLIGIGKYIRESHYISPPTDDTLNLIQQILDRTCDELIEENKIQEDHKHQVRFCCVLLGLSVLDKKIDWSDF